MRTLHKDPTHVILAEEAKSQIDGDGEFDKHSVIEGAGFGAYEDKITDLVNWKHVQSEVEVEAGALVPMTMPGEGGRFNPALQPEKFVPGGPGKKTEAWAKPMKYPQVSLEYLNRRVAAAVGLINQANALGVSFANAGLPIDFKPATAPTLQLQAAAE